MDVLTAPIHRRRAALIVSVVTIALTCLYPSPPATAAGWGIGLAASSKGLGRSTTLPSAPTSPSATCALVGLKITVTWNAVANASTYKIYQSTNGANGTYTVAASGTGVTGTTWTSNALSTGTYYYKVSAFIGVNWESSTSVATAGRNITVILCT